ncbi:hypothetical protein [Nocardia brasiliensis]|uniref:hypothetical protein n=1 Tax=Nocardia brasiliensis TaxID=37326 RepID=UPI00366ABD94
MRKPVWRKVSTLATGFRQGGVSTRARLQSLVDRLELPADWTAEEFFASVERLRGRRIMRLPLPSAAPVGLCGLWLACQDHDVIFLRGSPDPAVQVHVGLHEVGHMLLDHGGDRSLSGSELAAVLTGIELSAIDISQVQAARGVSSYATTEEYEAELLATLIGIQTRTSGPRRDWLLKEL